jgi:glc operon protein GlcG
MEETMQKVLAVTFVTVLFACGSFGAAAQTPAPAPAPIPQYGANINLEQARKALAAAEAEARRQGWPVAIAVVDTAGLLVAYLRLDNTQTAGVQLALDKATSAAMFRRSTKDFFDRVAAGGGGMSVLNLRGAQVSEGGLPILLDGKIIGGIGVSGVAAPQDAMVAKAGVDAIR